MAIPVSEGAGDGSQVTEPGQLQYGPLLLGVGTSAGWVDLTGWRDLPGASPADSQRPQAHGSVPGSVYGDSLVVTYTYLVRGKAADKQAYVDLIERHTPMDGVDRALVVDDGSGPELRMARVIGRTVPQDKHYRHGPLTCYLQFLCADPRRYSLRPHTAVVRIPVTIGGLDYPVEYPADYGTYVPGGGTVTNDGNEPAPVVVTFRGPLVNPVLHAPGWQLGFDLTLADGDALTVDSLAGTALLNGSADRLYTIRRNSDPIEWATIPPGTSNLRLTALSGSGTADVTYRDARM